MTIQHNTITCGVGGNGGAGGVAGSGGLGGSGGAGAEELMMVAREATAELEGAEDVVDMAEEGAVVQASVSSLRAAHPRWVRETSTP